MDLWQDYHGGHKLDLKQDIIPSIPRTDYVAKEIELIIRW